MRLIALVVLLASSARAGTGPSSSQAGAFNSAISSPTAVATLANSVGKTEIWISSTAGASAISSIIFTASYTVPLGNTFYLQHFDISGYANSFSSFPFNMGSATLESATGTVYSSAALVNYIDGAKPFTMDFPEPKFFTSNQTVFLKIKTNSANAMTFFANLVGIKK